MIFTEEQRRIIQLWDLGFNTQEIADKVFPQQHDREARVYNMLSFIRHAQAHRGAA